MIKNSRGMEQIYSIEAGNFALAGEASGHIKKLLKQLGVNSGMVRRVTIAAYETEMNLVIHSLGGHIKLNVTPETIILTAQDRGPGIADIELAMKEGYSTAPDLARELGFGAGMGLPNIKRCADSFSINSKVGQGSVMKIYFKI
jgi:serine/threonine-protein kinase RsbT